MQLYRPVGLQEMIKILDMKGKGFPLRLPEQTIFYPVINSTYATQIAKDWNVLDSRSGYAGFVTTFEIEDAYIEQYEMQCVGDRIHEECWIPAEEVSTFNNHIRGSITIIDAFYGEQYIGIKPLGTTKCKEERVEQQISTLEEYNTLDLNEIIVAEWKLMNTNLKYWEKQKICNKTIIRTISDCLKNNNILIFKYL